MTGAISLTGGGGDKRAVTDFFGAWKAGQDEASKIKGALATDRKGPGL